MSDVMVYFVTLCVWIALLVLRMRMPASAFVQGMAWDFSSWMTTGCLVLFLWSAWGVSNERATGCEWTPLVGSARAVPCAR